MKNELQEQIEKIVSLRGYEYRLWHYQASHSVLTLRAYQPANPGYNLHLVFETVFFVQLPIHWPAGDFRLGTVEEHKNITTQIGFDEFKASQVILFVAEPPNSTVFLLCHSASVKYDVPPLY
jgi:hypothetical protein